MPSTGSAAASPGVCRTQDVAVRLGQPEPAKFQAATVVELANTAGPCTVSGEAGGVSSGAITLYPLTS